MIDVRAAHGRRRLLARGGRGAAAETHDLDALGAREYRNDLLDQLVTELLLGVR